MASTISSQQTEAPSHLAVTDYQACYLAHHLTRLGAVGEIDQISSTLFDAKVDLNPHQVDAALFALANPLQQGVILADEVGLGKTIEAGLVLCQRWAERRRKLIVVAPAHIRKQWQQELSEKFNLPSTVIDRGLWNQLRRDGNPNPFDCGKIVIVSYAFAARMKDELRSVPFDLVVLDEAHKLRNAYQPSRKGGQAIRWSFELRQKLLLTATPLQNSLLELYGLGWFIGDHVFGDKSSFQSRYCNAGGDVAGLRSRLGQLCKRTLRKQCPYVNYTKRQAITHPFSQTVDEKNLHNDVTQFMSRGESYAFPLRQRFLIEMILFKTLASSPQALASTLRTMKARLEAIRDGLSADDLDKFLDSAAEDDLDIDGLLEQLDAEDEDTEQEEVTLDPKLLSQELTELDSLITRAEAIDADSKSKALLMALEHAFERLNELGAAKKALIFTESRKTQDFLAQYLEANGYAGKVVLFNGSNTHQSAKRAYDNFTARYAGTDKLSGSKAVDVRSALIEEFERSGQILLATEAAAEGVNLQFCSLVVNYDLPWNPQRIEQRIGRCHRYGQKFDVVVVNFLSQDNLADRRVQDLLQQKFSLFDGLFGASDQVLGTIEDGVDFEKRVIQILKSCRTDAEINQAFDELQQELEATITEKMSKAREQLLEHFDADVHERLNVTARDARIALDRVGDRLWRLAGWGLRDLAQFDSNELALTVKHPPTSDIPPGRYQLISAARTNGSSDIVEADAHLLRLSSPLGQWLIQSAKSQTLLATVSGTADATFDGQGPLLAVAETHTDTPPATNRETKADVVEFNVSKSERKISMLQDLIGQSGWLQVDKLTLTNDATEEYLLLTAICDSNQNLDQEIADRLFDVPAHILRQCELTASVSDRLAADSTRLREATIARASENGNKRFKQAQSHVNQWADDKITAAELQLDTLRRAAKNTEITAFLDRHLKETVREVLESRGSDESTKLASEIAKAREAATTAGFNPDDSPRVKELEEQYAKLGGGSTEELEADIYNHLLNFFSRHYDEGDFISKRFYKGDTYAIPYGGEEVTLHWANKDQYYIKSGEWHKDYRFTLGNKVTRFRVFEAAPETSNSKDENGKRRYILDHAYPVEVENDSLTLFFQFRVPTDQERLVVKESEATRIYGGDYNANKSRSNPEQKKSGDEREQFCADAERRARERMSEEWLSVAGQLEPTTGKPLRTVLGKQIDHFTARSAFDYFIHKDLAAFFIRELDFYLKNEVLRLDDIENALPDRLARTQAMIVAIRRVASRITSFLSCLENFQRKVWLKKKFVLETNWLVTLDRVPDELIEQVAECDEQWVHWEALGFQPSAEQVASLFPNTEWRTLAYLGENRRLVLDTAFFSSEFKSQLLASESIRGEADSIDEATVGSLVHGDNFHALNLLATSFRGSVKFTYIDPPYNTGEDDFCYKDDFQHSSWLSMLSDRLSLGRQFEESIATISVSIDDAELHRLCELLRVAYADGELAKLVWDRNRKNDARYFSVGHEYMVIACSDRSALAEAKVKFREPKDGVEKAREFFARLRRSHKDNWDVIRSKWLAWFETIPVSDPKRRMMRYTKVNKRGPYRDDGNINWPGGGGPRYEVLHPQTSKPCRIPNSGWRYPTAERFWEVHGEGKIAFGPDEATVPATISYLFESDDQVMHSVHYSYAQTAAQEFDAIFGKRVFDNPKNWRDIKRLCSYLSAEDSVVLDYFAGSGTTAHAVINLNRDTGSKRKFLLAEMGGYFESVLKPRIAKILYSPDWNNGTCSNHQLGVSAVVKYFAVESYEDALNNLPSPTDQLLHGVDESTWNTLIQYALDVELGPRILRMEWFKDPWKCKLYAQPAGKPSATIHNVGMVETFNYLIGLKVQAYGPFERYSAEFVRLPHGDDKDSKGNPLPEDKREGRLRIEGRLRRDAEGTYVYQRVEGELNDGNATRVLVIWRKLTDDAEKDAAVLEAWMARHRESTKERSDYREYHLIYLNGPITLPQPTQELRTVLPTEQTFKDRMFEDTE